MTPRNAELNDEFKEIPLKIEIEVKRGGKKRLWQEKICKIYKNFDNLIEENSRNWK